MEGGWRSGGGRGEGGVEGGGSEGGASGSREFGERGGGCGEPRGGRPSELAQADRLHHAMVIRRPLRETRGPTHRFAESVRTVLVLLLMLHVAISSAAQFTVGRGGSSEGRTRTPSSNDLM